MKSGKHTSRIMTEDFRKYGKEGFEVYILEQGISYQERKKEYEYMKKYNSFDEKYGYNRGDIKQKNVKKMDYIYKLPPNLYEQDTSPNDS